MRRFQLAGHLPLALVGGATGMIGDPKPTSERTLNEAEVVVGAGRTASAASSSGSSTSRARPPPAWSTTTTGPRPMSVIEFLRDIGKHFSVNRMLDREAVARRLADQGISYTEFSYVLLQSMDYLELFRRYGCRLQTGGSDQCGNIVAGVDLVRRVEGASVHALTTPLMTKADGTKFGKTEGGAVWLDPELTSPYAFYQFWLNTDDRDVPGQPAHVLLPQPRGDRGTRRRGRRAPGCARGTAGPGRGADRDGARAAGAGGGARRPRGRCSAPGSCARSRRRPSTPRCARRSSPRCRSRRGRRSARSTCSSPPGSPPSKGAARRTIAEGGAYVNNVRVADESATFTPGDTLAGGWLVVRRGGGQCRCPVVRADGRLRPDAASSAGIAHSHGRSRARAGRGFDPIRWTSRRCSTYRPRGRNERPVSP